MKALAVLVLVAAVAGFFGYRQFLRPEARACRKVAELCSLEPAERDRCVSDLDEFGRTSGAEPVAKFTTCVADASSCPEATGCLAGAGLRAAGGAIEQFFKGIGKALK